MGSRSHLARWDSSCLKASLCFLSGREGEGLPQILQQQQVQSKNQWGPAEKALMASLTGLGWSEDQHVGLVLALLGRGWLLADPCPGLGTPAVPLSRCPWCFLKPPSGLQHARPGMLLLLHCQWSVWERCCHLCCTNDCPSSPAVMDNWYKMRQ